MLKELTVHRQYLRRSIEVWHYKAYAVCCTHSEDAKSEKYDVCLILFENMRVDLQKSQSQVVVGTADSIGLIVLDVFGQS